MALEVQGGAVQVQEQASTRMSGFARTSLSSPGNRVEAGERSWQRE